MAMKRRKFDEYAGYRPDRPLFSRSDGDLRRQLSRTVEARRLITDAPNRARAVIALGPVRQASAALN
jgi:hypothetical protein